MPKVVIKIMKEKPFIKLKLYLINYQNYIQNKKQHMFNFNIDICNKKKKLFSWPH